MSLENNGAHTADAVAIAAFRKAVDEVNSLAAAIEERGFKVFFYPPRYRRELGIEQGTNRIEAHIVIGP